MSKKTKRYISRVDLIRLLKKHKSLWVSIYDFRNDYLSHSRDRKISLTKVTRWSVKDGVDKYDESCFDADSKPRSSPKSKIDRMLKWDKPYTFKILKVRVSHSKGKKLWESPILKLCGVE